MGCVSSKSRTSSRSRSKREGKATKVVLKKWRAEPPITLKQLSAQRREFWDTQPYYGGNKTMWETLRAVVEAELSMKPVIIESAGLIIGSSDLSVFYDEMGWKYELPQYVLSNPDNLIEES